MKTCPFCQKSCGEESAHSACYASAVNAKKNLASCSLEKMTERRFTGLHAAVLGASLVLGGLAASILYTISLKGDTTKKQVAEITTSAQMKEKPAVSKRDIGPVDLRDKLGFHAQGNVPKRNCYVEYEIVINEARCYPEWPLSVHSKQHSSLLHLEQFGAIQRLWYFRNNFKLETMQSGFLYDLDNDNLVDVIAGGISPNRGVISIPKYCDGGFAADGKLIVYKIMIFNRADSVMREKNMRVYEAVHNVKYWDSIGGNLFADAEAQKTLADARAFFKEAKKSLHIDEKLREYHSNRNPFR